MTISRLTKFCTIAPVLLLLSSVVLAGVKDTVNQVKEPAMQKAYAYGDSAIESWAKR